jgi:hypothetical protein
MDITPPPIETVPPQPQTKIVDIRGNPITDLEIAAKEKEKKYCLSHHKNIWVDEHLRQIECRECGQIIDPFDYIQDWAIKGDRRMQHLQFLDDEAQKKKGEIEIMKAVLAREKAKVRKINPDAPEVQTIQRFYQRRKLPG